MSSSMQYVSNSNGTPANVGNETAYSFLVYPGQNCQEAWLLARAAPQNAGRPLRVRLYNNANQPLCDEMQVYSELSQRIRLQNVNIAPSAFPPVVKVVCSNESDQSALVEGVLLVFS